MGPLIRYDSAEKIEDSKEYLEQVLMESDLFHDTASLKISPFTGSNEKIFKITITIEEVK
jgi:hypothetical protein